MASTVLRRNPRNNDAPVSFSQIDENEEFSEADLDEDEEEERASAPSPSAPSSAAASEDADASEDAGDDAEDGDADEEARETRRAPPPPRRRPGRPPKVRDALASQLGVPSSALKAEQARNHDDFEQLLSELDFSDSKHKVNVSRTWPDKTSDGQPCSGFLRTYENRVSLAEIQNTFGGGTFVVQVRGPGPLGKGSLIKTTKTIQIPGEPIVPRIVNPRAEEEKAASNVATIVQQALTAQQKEQERLHQKLAETERRLFDVLAKKDGDMGSFFPTLLEKMQEERKLDEMRRMEERRLEEERRREEREAARLEREAADRRWREEMEERRRAHEKEMAMIEARSREESKTQAQSTNMLLEFFRAKETADKESRHELKDQTDKMSQAYMTMMQQGSKQSVEMLMSTMATTNQMMMQALQQKRGGIGEFAEQIIAMKEAMKVLNGEEDPEPETTADKVIRVFKEDVAPMVTPMLGQVMAARAGRGAPQALPTAMVDLGPARRSLPNPAPAPVAQPQRPPPAQYSATEQHEETHEEAQEETAEMADNDFTEFVFPEKADVQTVAVPSLVKNIDLAIQRGYSAAQIRAEVVPFFEKNYRMAMLLIKGMSADELVGFLEERTPPTWTIVSPRGVEVLKELHALLQ